MNETNFWGFLLAGVVTATLHALLPNHWLPFLAAARFYRWTKGQLFRFALLVAFAHASVTVGLGVLMALLGKGIVHTFHEHATKIAGVTLLGLAAIFLFAPHLYGHRHIHYPECEHCRNAGQTVTVAGLFVALTLSPCEGLLPIFFAAAVQLGWATAFTIAIVSSLLTVVLLVVAVQLAFHGWERLLPQVSEHHERWFASGLLLLLAFLLLAGKH